MQLETVQSFTKTPMNTFRKIEANEAFELIEEKSLVGNNNQLKRIRPNIYRTFLKVKNPHNIQQVLDKCRCCSSKFLLFIIQLMNIKYLIYLFF